MILPLHKALFFYNGAEYKVMCFKYFAQSAYHLAKTNIKFERHITFKEAIQIYNKSTCFSSAFYVAEQQEASFALLDKRDFFDGKKRVKGTKRQKVPLKGTSRTSRKAGCFCSLQCVSQADIEW